MKLYNPLILNKIQKCKKKNVKAPKKKKQALFPRHIHVSKFVYSIPQYRRQILNTANRRHVNHIVTSIAAAGPLNCCGNGLIRGVPPQHRISAQRWVDGITMWPNAAGTFQRPLASVYVYQTFVWVKVGFIKMWI